jgi:hypothetical protein
MPSHQFIILAAVHAADLLPVSMQTCRRSVARIPSPGGPAGRDRPREPARPRRGAARTAPLPSSVAPACPPLESRNVPLVVVGRGGRNVVVLGALPPSRDSDGGEDTTLPTRHR